MFIMIIVIAVIAIAILAYFSFSGKGGGNLTPSALKDERVADSSVMATLRSKSVAASGMSKGGYLAFTLEFDCEDGIPREFSVSKEVYEAATEGARDILVFQLERFIGFGEHGALSDEPAVQEEDDFTMEDYDETIDVEIVPEIGGAIDLSPEDAEAYGLFGERKKLPPKSETVGDETQSLKGYRAAGLLLKTAIYPFLKREAGVLALFERVYTNAFEDLQGYAGSARHGVAADSIFINRNEIRVTIRLQEGTAPLAHTIEAEFGVNE